MMYTQRENGMEYDVPMIMTTDQLQEGNNMDQCQ